MCLTGNSFPLGKLRSPLKQVSVSDLAQLYLLREETTSKEQKVCVFCNATCLWDKRGKAAGKMNNGWERRVSGKFMYCWDSGAFKLLCDSKPKEEEAFFFSLRSFNLCPDCFHLKKKNVCNVGLFSFVICISVCWGVSVDDGSFAFFFF